MKKGIFALLMSLVLSFTMFTSTTEASTFVDVYLNGGTVNAPNGGDWVYKSGGPTLDPWGKDSLRMQTVKYISNEEVGAIAAATLSKKLVGDLLSLTTKEITTTTIVKFASKHLQPSKATAFKTVVGRLSIVYTAIEIRNLIVDLQNAKMLQQAYNQKDGILIASFASIYHGGLNYGKKMEIWTNYPYAPIPTKINGVGTFTPKN